MKRQAVLVFAHPIGLDLVRRRLPRFLQPLLSVRRLETSEPTADFHLFTTGKSAPLAGFQCHQQVGATFAERLEAATEKIAALGYDEIVLVGSDCPALQPGDIRKAFSELAEKRLVVGPDHRGGCYLIALRAADRALLAGIRWNRDSDRAELLSRVIPGAATVLSVKQDVDNWADVRLLARGGHRLVCTFLRFLLPANRAADTFVDLSAQRVRVRGQMPPPAFSA